MKVSIWQEWASNHSTDYVVVGLFQTPADAILAANEIRSILQVIKAWWDTLPEGERDKWAFQLTPPEEALRQHYEVEWPLSVDWYYFRQWVQKEEPVTAYDRFVTVHPPPSIDTWHGPQPFNVLLAKFGGQVAVSANESKTYPDTFIVTELSFSAPDEETLRRIQAEIERAKSREDIVPARTIFYGGYRNPYEEKLPHDAHIYFTMCATETYQDMKQFSVEHQNHLEDVMCAVSICSAEKPVALRVQGLQVDISDLQFDRENFIGLRTMIAWLNDLGCSSIDYRFREQTA